MMEKITIDTAQAVNNEKEQWSLPKFEVIGVDKTEGGSAYGPEDSFTHPLS